jgi:hypothetical protein
MMMAADDNSLHDQVADYDGEARQQAVRDGGDSGVVMMAAAMMVAAEDSSGGQQWHMAKTEFRFLNFESKGGQDHKFSHKFAGHNDPTKIFLSLKIPSLSLREEVSEIPSPPSTPRSCVA